MANLKMPWQKVTVMLDLLFPFFVGCGLLFLFLLVKGPSIWDRLLFLNLFFIFMLLTMIVYALMVEIDYLLDIAIVYALLGFIGIVFTARFIQRKGKI